jgi:hypothetical protein
MFGLFSIKTREERFWDWFAKKGQYYYTAGKPDENIDNELRKRLLRINKGLLILVTQNNTNGNQELLISANGKKSLIPDVRKIIDKAPKIDSWTFTSFIPRMPEECWKASHKEISFSYTDIFFRYEENPDHGLVLELNIRNYEPSFMSRNMIFMLLFTLLGEYDVASKVWLIDCKSLDESKIDSLQPIKELLNIIDKVKPKI